jgi:23S rRNA pseudouridine1911/1915/1917 synthase
MINKETQYKRENKSDYGHEKIEILYEDSYIVIINKPSGMLSVPYPGSRARTALDVLEQILRKRGECTTKHKPFVVHRLDRDTSGVMMFAMSEIAQKKIMDNWHTMVTERLYRAVAENPKGRSLGDEGILDSPIAYNAHNIGFVPHTGDRPSDERQIKKSRSRASFGEKSIHEKSVAIKNGRAEFKTISARTHYKVICRGAKHTLFELSLDTGRKNQIRAHLSDQGYPLAGDENYRARTNPFGRLALHARTLEFNHPFTREHLKFEVPEPEQWLKLVESEKGFHTDEDVAKRPESHDKNFSKAHEERGTRKASSKPKAKSRGGKFASGATEKPRATHSSRTNASPQKRISSKSRNK